MTIEFKEENYFYKMWFIGSDKYPIDYLGALFREKDGKIIFRGRFRIHGNDAANETEQIFQDKKSWYEMKFDKISEDLLQLIKNLLSELTKDLDGKLDEIEFNCYGTEAFEKFIETNAEWIHKFVPPQGMALEQFLEQIKSFSQN